MWRKCQFGPHAAAAGPWGKDFIKEAPKRALEMLHSDRPVTVMFEAG
jgi:hypothetical protein